jgi:hypothetical protein
MQRIMKTTISLVAMTVCVIATTPAKAQQAKETLPAPMPSQIVYARKVFLSNAGGDSHGLYSGESRRLYDQFYAALKSWGRYELAGSPAEADLVFEVSLINPFIGEYVYGGGGQTSVSSRSVTDPQFRLVILDPGTRVTLWVFTEHIVPAVLLSNRDKNFDQALNYLVNDLRNVAGQPVAAANGKK